MDLITVFPHVRQTERGPLPEDGCDEHTRSYKSVERAQSTSVSNMLNDGKGLSEFLKGHDAKPARRVSRELAPRISIGPNPADQETPEAVPLRNEQTVQQDGVLKSVMHQRHKKSRAPMMGGKEVSPRINVARVIVRKKRSPRGIKAFTDIMGVVFGSSSYLDACLFC